MRELKKRIAIVSAIAVVVLVMACGGGGSKVSISDQDHKEADAMFLNRCAACHGTNGEGNGPAAAALNPKPRNYHDMAWQTSTTDEEIEKAIVYGGAAVGKSPQMAPNPDLQSKPGVVAALREKVRSFGK